MSLKTLFQVILLTINLFFVCEAASARSYAQRSDLENVRPVAELGWTVPLHSGKSYFYTGITAWK